MIPPNEPAGPGGTGPSSRKDGPLEGRVPPRPSALLSRVLLLLGGLLFAIAFFVPPDSTRTPVEMLKWTADAACTSDTAGEAAAFGGVALVIAYPYAWALALIVVAALWERWAWGRKPWLHLIAHTIGGLTLTALCGMFLVLGDPWMPRPVQLTGAIVPVVLLAVMWTLGLRLPHARRSGAVIAAGALLLLPLQLVLVRISAVRGLPAWGFAIGAAGALLLLAGGLGLCAGGTKRD